VDSLTYDHLCIIAFYGRRDEFQAIDLPIAGLFSYDSDLIGEDVVSAARDLLMLIQAGILRHPSSQYLEHMAIQAAKLLLAPRGQVIFDLLDLQFTLTYDVETAIRPLEYKEEWGLDRNGKRNGRPVAPEA
jgi:hypothetical protein